jgi:glycine/D-amino acid oxidase-like deaminating enzyme
MKNYDWIVVGGGIAGAALAYELAKKDFSVLLLEKDATLKSSATRYSYGGLAYWSGTSELTRILCKEGIELHRILPEELEADTQFREVDLVLTIPLENEPEKVAAAYSKLAIPPKLISVESACELEPLLNPEAISGALTVRHGHIHPEKTTEAYVQAFLRAGGKIQIARVRELLREGQQIQGVKTQDCDYYAANTVVCAGGMSRALLKAAGINIPLYFTHAEIVEIPPVDFQLKTLVMPANLQRFELEAKASTTEVDSLWDEPGNELVPPILDAGAIQFLDGSLRIGQLSRVLTNPYTQVDATASEKAIRTQVEKVLPALEKLPGTWHQCLVAFSCNCLAVVGKVNNLEGGYVFCGLTSPLVSIPPLAKRFANWVSGEEDAIISQLFP